MMEKQVLKTIKKYDLISPGDVVIAAVSGGPDSVAMLHILHSLSFKWGIKIHVAHLNHMFRGEQAAEEALFVQNLARNLGLSYTVEAFDVPSYIKETGSSPQEAAREVRYKFLRRIARELGAKGIITGHHADDQAETVLLHLLRGSGPEGLAAISPKEGDLIRPLLEVTKENILQYCHEKSLQYRLDPSNEKTNYQRNKVRLSLIPILKEYNPKIVDALVRTAEICRRDNDFLHEATARALENLGLNALENEARIEVKTFKSLHPSLQRRVLRAVFDQMAQTKGGLGHYHTEEILGLSTGKEIPLPHKLYARREFDVLLITSRSMNEEREITELQLLDFPVPGSIKIPQLGIRLEAQIKSWPDKNFKSSDYVAAFNLDVLKEPLSVRTRREGDRFKPAGLKGTKKLKDYFIDEKVPQYMRDKIPLLLSGDEIIWVVGYRAGHRVKISPKDKKALVITGEKLFEA